MTTTINSIAAAAYAAYAKELHRRIGVNMRPWVDTGSSDHRCWEAAVLQVLAIASTAGVQMPAEIVPRSTSIAPDPERDDQSVWLALHLVGGNNVPLSAVQSWTDDECHQATAWAHLMHLHASDHDDIAVPPMPACVQTYATAKPFGSQSHEAG